jgi:hypothetical protein
VQSKLALSLIDEIMEMETEKYQTGLKRVWAAIVDIIVFMPFLLIDYWIVIIRPTII